MTRKPVPGLFVTGNDTEVGKTHVTAMIAAALAAAGRKVGVYKPVASGCWQREDSIVSPDALMLWEAAGRPGELERVCPQRFLAPIAPHLAARAEGREIDADLLREGLKYWRERSDIVLVEGAGGLMSPLGDEEYVADLAADLRLPLLVVAANRLGVINHTLQTLIAAAVFENGLDVAGVVLNDVAPSAEDPSRSSNLAELRARCVPPVLAHVKHGAERFDPPVEWEQIIVRRRGT